MREIGLCCLAFFIGLFIGFIVMESEIQDSFKKGFYVKNDKIYVITETNIVDEVKNAY